MCLFYEVCRELKFRGWDEGGWETVHTSVPQAPSQVEYRDANTNTWKTGEVDYVFSVSVKCVTGNEILGKFFIFHVTPFH